MFAYLPLHTLTTELVKRHLGTRQSVKVDRMLAAEPNLLLARSTFAAGRICHFLGRFLGLPEHSLSMKFNFFDSSDMGAFLFPFAGLHHS